MHKISRHAILSTPKILYPPSSLITRKMECCLQQPSPYRIPYYPIRLCSPLQETTERTIRNNSFYVVHFCYSISILATSSTFFILRIFSMACFSSLEECTSENMRFFAQAFLPPLVWACFLQQASHKCYRLRNHLWSHRVYS